MKCITAALSSVCGLMAFGALTASAQFPAQDMGPTRLGVAYEFLLQGQAITKEEIGSEQVLHGLKLGYAPVPYVTLGLGLGLAKFETSPFNQGKFEGRYGFSPSFSLDLASPAFLQNILRGTLGCNTQYLNSTDGNHLTYSAYVVDPSLGLKVSPVNYLDADIGGRLHFVQGQISRSSSSNSSTFSNGQALRGFAALTLKTPYEHVFIRFEGDLSQDFDANWSNGPIESTFRISVGGLLAWRGKQQDVARPSPYFPNYREMKEREEQMKDELEDQ